MIKRLTLLIFGFVIFALPAQAAYLDIKEVKSDGGLSAWLVEDHSVPVIALRFAFRGAGSATESEDMQGLARLASNTMDEGAGDLDAQEFQKALRDLVIDLHFTSGRDHFGGNLKTLSKNKDRAFDLLRLALTQPRFDQDAVDRMRNANQSRIRASISDPNWQAARLFNAKAFEGHPYALNSGGTLSTLENITPDDLRTFAAKLARNQLVISAAGDITAQELSQVIDQIFGALPENTDLPAPTPLTLQNQGQSFVFTSPIPQTIIEMAQPGIDRDDPDYHYAQIMNFILGSSGFGSRLTEEIREKRGLTYGIYSSLDDQEQINLFSVSTSTKNETAKEMLSLIHQEWQKMRDAPVTDTELQNAKSYLIGALPLSLTSTDKIAGLLLSLQLDDLPVDYLDQRQAKIENATIDDISRVSKALLQPSSFVTIIVGQPQNIDGATEIETLPHVE